MSINAEQIRGARAFLNLNRNELAALAGVSSDTIGRLEAGNKGDDKTLQSLRRAMEHQGIEFGAYSAVRRRPEGLQNFQGQEGLLEFLDDVYKTLKETGGEILCSGVDEALFSKHITPESEESHGKRMAEISALTCRTIIKEGDHNFFAGDYSQYRWLSADKFYPLTFYVYADKFAIIDFEGQYAPYITLITSNRVARGYRAVFEVLWAQSKEPPKKRVAAK